MLWPLRAVFGREADPAEYPLWVGYLTAVLLTVLVTVFQRLLQPFQPLAQYPTLYILLVVGTAYLFGVGPAVVTFVLSLLAYLYLFIEPIHFFWPPASTLAGWVRIESYLIGTVLGGALALVIRQSMRRAQMLADDLERQKALLEVFTRNVPVGLAFLDRELRHVIANEAIARMRGVAVEEMLGKTVSEVLPPEMALRVERAYEQAMSRGIADIWSDYPMRSRNEERYYCVHHYPVRTAAGEFVGVGVVVLDTTDEVVRRHELEHHLALLQKALLPSSPHISDGYRVAAAYLPARAREEIGGDFYDVFPTADGRAEVVIGDVSGKGIEAAALAAATRSTIHAFAYQSASPGLTLTKTNEVLCAQSPHPESFVTVFLADIEPSTGITRYTNAGHPPVLAYHSSGEVESCTFGLPPLCLRHDQEFFERQCVLQPGDKMLLYTDGISEARHNGEMLGIEGIERVLRECGELSADQIVETLLSVAKDWSHGRLSDDVAIVVVERLPPGVSGDPPAGASLFNNKNLSI
jgi:PAS domain S-box-containing protein